MRQIAWVSAFVFTAAAGLATAASQQSTSTKVDFPDTVTWAGKTLPAGQHTVRWDGDSGNVDVTILDGSRTLAEGHARVEASKTKYPDDAVVTQKGASATPVLKEIELGGKTVALVFGQS